MDANHYTTITRTETRPIIKFAVALQAAALGSSGVSVTPIGAAQLERGYRETVAILLSTFAKVVDALSVPEEDWTIFDSANGRTPEIPMTRYVERAMRLACAPREVLVQTVMLVDRCIGYIGQRYLRPSSVHRFFITAFVLMSKMQEDVHYESTFYGKVGGLKAAELNCLQKDMFQACSSNAWFSLSEYMEYSDVIGALMQSISAVAASEWTIVCADATRKSGMTPETLAAHAQPQMVAGLCMT
jgi:hypothetical protein